MTTKEELLKQIGELYAEAKKVDISAEILKSEINSLNEAIKKLDQPVQYGRWEPKEGEEYYYIDSSGLRLSDYRNEGDNTLFCYRIGNCFRTKEQAERAIERLKIRIQLEDIALRLNKGQKINWDDVDTQPYYLRLSIGPLHKWIELKRTYSGAIEDTVYCLDSNFKDVAISEIGEERLAKYLKGE